jgi:hypothetical protein
MQETAFKPGDVVIIAAFDDVPEHLFRIEEVFEEMVTGLALTGPFAGEYGEPEVGQIVRLGTTSSVED